MSQLDEAIFQILTQNPNKWMSAVAIYNSLDSKEYKDKKDFIMNCELLPTRFKHIRKCHKNSLCYLAFIADESLISKAIMKIEEDADNETTSLFNSLDKLEVIDYMINNPDTCRDLSLTEYFDGNNTIMHILFKNGRTDLVKKLFESYNADLSITNSEGKSIIDVIDYSSVTAPELVKIYLDYELARISLENLSALDGARKTNNSLLEANKKLLNENRQLKSQITTTKFRTLFAWFVFLTILFIRFIH